MKGSLTYHDHRGEYSQALSLYKGRNNKKLNYSEVESDPSASRRNKHSRLYATSNSEMADDDPPAVHRLMNLPCRRKASVTTWKDKESTNNVHVTTVGRGHSADCTDGTEDGSVLRRAARQAGMSPECVWLRFLYHRDTF